MKRIFLLSVTCLSFINLSFANNDLNALAAVNRPYLGFQMGPAFPTASSLNTGFNFGLEGGYQFYNNFRIEEAFNYMRQSLINQSYYTTSNNHYNTFTLMTNVYYNIFTHTALSPFIGLGIGWLHSRLSTYEASFSPSKVDTFAYQGIVGAAYHLTPQASLDLQYRYLSSASGINNNILELGLNYRF